MHLLNTRTCEHPSN